MAGQGGSDDAGTGPYRSYFAQESIGWASHARAWCIGDRETVERLVRRVRQLGPRRRYGYGQVQSVSVTVDEAAESGWADRNMPDPLDGYAPVFGRIRPPYWGSNDVRIVYKPRAPAVLEV